MTLALIALFSAAAYCAFLVALRIGLTNLEAGRERNIATISIIVAMRNEGNNGRSCLEALIRQNYPRDKMEIVIVDDGSTDETPQLLEEYQQRCSFIKVIHNDPCPQNFGGKKLALRNGIAESSGEILLFTDADCAPSPGWVRAMTAYFAPGVGLVAGFSPLLDPKDTFIGKLLLIDSLANGTVAAGSIGLGSAVTCTGRNLAYRRQVYFQVNGFNDIMHSISGDDDLFLQLVHRKTDWRIRFAIEPSTIVPSFQTKTVKELFLQKKRHLSAGKYYPVKLKLAYFVFHFSNIMLYLFFFTSLLTGQNILLSMALLGSKFLLDGFVLHATGELFGFHPKMLYLFAWELFFVVYHVIIAPLSWCGRIRWK